MNLRRVVLSTIMALVLIAPFAPAQADVVLTGDDRKDPCQQMRYWQDQMTKNPSSFSEANLEVNYANACALTYTPANLDARCDAYLAAASAADAVLKVGMSQLPRLRAIYLGEAIAAYSLAGIDCGEANRPQILLDYLEAGMDRNKDSLWSLLKNP